MSNTNEEVIQKFIDGLTTGESLNHLSDMIDNIDDVLIEVVDQKWAIEDNMLDPLINKMDTTLSNIDKNGVLYKGDYYGTKNLEEWGWYKNTGILNVYHIDDNTFYVNGDKRSTFSSGEYIIVNYSNKKIPRRVSSSVLSGADTYVHLSTSTSDDLWDNPYYDPNDPARPTCVNPDINKAYCDCYLDTERPYTTTTTSTTTTETFEYQDGIFKITIDSSKVQTPGLSGYPVFLNLSNSSGYTNLDMTKIFDEISDNWLKLYIKDNDGNNLYVEVDYWDIINKKANLYVRVPYISTGYYTNLWGYYGNDLDDNNKIGKIDDIDTSSNCELVWDFEYYNQSIYHFSKRELSDNELYYNSFDSAYTLRSGSSNLLNDLVDLNDNRKGLYQNIDNETSVTIKSEDYLTNETIVIAEIRFKLINGWYKNISSTTASGMTIFNSIGHWESLHLDRNNGKLEFRQSKAGVSNDDNHLYSNISSWAANTFYHVIIKITRDLVEKNSTVQMYINGVLDNEKETNYETNLLPTTLYIGEAYSSLPYSTYSVSSFKGTVDMFRKYFSGNNRSNENYFLTSYYDLEDELCKYEYIKEL